MSFRGIYIKTKIIFTILGNYTLELKNKEITVIKVYLNFKLKVLIKFNSSIFISDLPNF